MSLYHSLYKGASEKGKKLAPTVPTSEWGARRIVTYFRSKISKISINRMKSKGFVSIIEAIV
jgi:hypothetical protein